MTQKDNKKYKVNRGHRGKYNRGTLSIIIIIMYIEHHSGKDVRARVTDAEGHARPGRSAGG